MIDKHENRRDNIQIVSISELVPSNHLLRKIDNTMKFDFVYDLVKDKYSEDTGRPSIDPVILIKMVLIQHLFGIRSLRQTSREIQVNVAYRWFLGYDFTDKVPHFSTISYNFIHKFPPEITENIFMYILEQGIKRGHIKPEAIFIDATHIKANANKKRKHKELAEIGAKSYEKQLREEVNADREARGKKPLEDNSNSAKKTREITVSNVDPESGIFRKGEHKVEFAYETHTASDEHGYILGNVVTAGNIHDSQVFDRVYDKVMETFKDVKDIAIDSAYRTTWICKKIIDDGKIPSMPYKRPTSKKGFFYPSKYLYDEKSDCIICPNNKILKYTTTTREGLRQYKSNPKECVNCPDLYRCTESKRKQKVVTRHIWCKYLEKAEEIRLSPHGKEIYSKRKETIERVFADAKEKHAMRYTPYRGLKRVAQWVTLKFACMNLKKMALRESYIKEFASMYC